jgi:hypothetical protein
VTFFLDNTHPPRLAKALNALVVDDGHTAVHLREKFAPETEDELGLVLSQKKATGSSFQATRG